MSYIFDKALVFIICDKCGVNDEKKILKKKSLFGYHNFLVCLIIWASNIPRTEWKINTALNKYIII